MDSLKEILKQNIIGGKIESIIDELNSRDTFDDYAAAVSNAALGTCDLGYLDSVLIIQRNLLSFMRKTLPEDHSYIAMGMNNLANTLAEMGQLEEALILYEDCLDMRRKILPGDHPEIAESLGNIGLTLLELGNYNQAVIRIQEALDMSRKVLPAHHSNITMYMNNLAIALDELGQYVEAQKLKENVLKIRQASLPSDHPGIASAMGNLAVSLNFLGRYDEALLLHSKALALRRTVLPEGHPRIAESLGNLSTAYFDTGNYGEALRLKEEAIAILKARFPPDHPSILSRMMGKANILMKLAHHEEALIIYGQVLSMRRRTLSDDNPSTINIMRNYAVSLEKCGRLIEALEIEEKILSLLHKNFPPFHPDIAEVTANLAITLGKLNRCAEGLELEARVLADMKLVWPEDHPKVAQAAKNLAISLDRFGRSDEALQYYIEAQRINLKNQGDQITFLRGHQREERFNHLMHEWIKLSVFIKGFAAVSHYEKAAISVHVENLLSLKGLESISVSLRPTLLAHASNQLKPVFENLFALQGIVARLTLSDNPEDFEPLQRNLKLLKAAEAAADASKEGRALRARLRLNVLTTPDIASALPVGGALLSFSDLRDENGVQHWFVTVVHQDGQVAVQELPTIDPVELTSSIKTLWANLILPEDKVRLPKHGRAVKVCQTQLYQWLIQPVEGALLRDGAFPTSLTISGDGELYGLPWELLTNDAGELLLDLTVVNLIPTPRDLVRLHSLEDVRQQAQEAVAGETDPANRADSVGRSVVVGIREFGSAGQEQVTGPDIDADSDPQRGVGSVALRGLDEAFHSVHGFQFEPLTSAVQEAEEVAKLLDPAPVVLTDKSGKPGDRPTRQNFQEYVNRPRILHVATHSEILTLDQATELYTTYAQQHPQERLVDAGMGVTLEPGHPFSRVILAFQGANTGGLTEMLLAWEVAALPLQGTELVVFSSCHSGRVEASVGEGLAGLSTAAFLAGAERTISTLWAVYDQQAAVFIWNVYRHWVKDGGSVASAFQAVKRECRKSGLERRHPLESGFLPSWPDQNGQSAEVEIEKGVWAAFVLNGLP